MKTIIMTHTLEMLTSKGIAVKGDLIEQKEGYIIFKYK